MTTFVTYFSHLGERTRWEFNLQPDGMAAVAVGNPGMAAITVQDVRVDMTTRAIDWPADNHLVPDEVKARLQFMVSDAIL